MFLVGDDEMRIDERTMIIQILCHECQPSDALEKIVMTAAKAIGMEYQLERIQRGFLARQGVLR